MAHEIDLGGVLYISSKRAAEKYGYTQDYIGQISRAGHVEAKKVSGLWYIQEDSLKAYKEKADLYKPEPPKRVAIPTDPDAPINFDGRDFVSASKAAQITGYNPDYVGQLARSGKVTSRQIGNRWYVDSQELVEHKREKDALLAAVQANAVGLSTETKDMPPEPDHARETLEVKQVHHAESPRAQVQAQPTHFTYTPQHEPLMPEVREKTQSERDRLAEEVGLYRPQRTVPIRREEPMRAVRPHKEFIEEVHVEEEVYAEVLEETIVPERKAVHASRVHVPIPADAEEYQEVPEKTSNTLLYVLILPSLVLIIAAAGYLYLLKSPSTSEASSGGLMQTLQGYVSTKVKYERQ